MPLGRPPNVAARAKQLARTLQDFRVQVIPRVTWEAIVIERYEVAAGMVLEITKVGERLGYWIRRRGKAGGPRGGSQAWVVEVLGVRPTSTPLAQIGESGRVELSTTNPLTTPISAE